MPAASEQPTNFGFGDDETRLRDSVAAFLSDHCDPQTLHGLVAADYETHRAITCAWDRSLWDRVVELGWPAVCVPTEAGGLGMPVVAAVAIAEQVGRAAWPSPLLSTYIATAVLSGCGTESASRALADIAAGTPTTLAITNGAGSWDPSDTDVRFEHDRLHGEACFVQNAKKCSRFVVSARSTHGVGLYQVESDTSGLDIVADGIVDLTRDQAHLHFDNVAGVELVAPGAGQDALAEAVPTILTLLSADMVGAAEWLLQTTVQYAKDRVQFDRPLGFFQAVKHPLVNVMLDIDKAKSLVYHAACSIDCDDDAALLNARMAKSMAGDTATFSASRAVQLHGGIGFTWESYVHIWFKRQMHTQMLWGDAKYQRTQLAEMVMGGAPD